MSTTARKVRMTVTLPQFEADYIRKEAKRIGWSLSALAGEYILDGMYKRPNADTLAAIEEARSGVEMEELTPYQIEHFEEYVASL